MYVFSSDVRWFFPGVIGTDHRLLTWFKKPLTGDGRLELTRIFVDNNRQDPRNAWFTICFEAFAPEIARTRTVLDSCARLALDELGLPPGRGPRRAHVAQLHRLVRYLGRPVISPRHPQET